MYQLSSITVNPLFISNFSLCIVLTHFSYASIVQGNLFRNNSFVSNYLMNTLLWCCGHTALYQFYIILKKYVSKSFDILLLIHRQKRVKNDIQWCSFGFPSNQHCRFSPPGSTRAQSPVLVGW